MPRKPGIPQFCSIPECGRPHEALGLCHLHYRRYRQNGDPLVVRQVQHHGVELHERFLARVDQTTDCWLWTGSKDVNGYGRIRIGTRPELTHRVAWQLFRGDIPEGGQILHHCDNPSCVRPEHLFLGNPAANCADKIAKGRQRYGVSYGEQHGMVILTEQQVLEIRKAQGPSRIIAQSYGVSSRTIRQIRNRETWRHI